MAILNKARMHATLLRKAAQLVLLACVVSAYYGFWLGGHPYAVWFASAVTLPAAAVTAYTWMLYRRQRVDEERERQRIVAWQRRMSARVRSTSRARIDAQEPGARVTTLATRART